MESIEGALNEGLEPNKTPESQMAAHQVIELGDGDVWRHWGSFHDAWIKECTTDVMIVQVVVQYTKDRRQR